MKVFCLHPADGVPRQVSQFEKAEATPFQAPGCTKEGSNGIKLPTFVKTSILTAELNPVTLVGWDNARADVLEALGGRRKPERQAEAADEATFAEAAFEDSQEVQISTCFHRN